MRLFPEMSPVNERPVCRRHLLRFPRRWASGTGITWAMRGRTHDRLRGALKSNLARERSEIGVTITTMGKQVSLTLRDVDEAVIGPYLTEGTPASNVLRRWASKHGQVAGDIKSEGDALRALLRIGAEALQEQVLDAGYGELASEFNHHSADAERRAARSR